MVYYTDETPGVNKRMVAGYYLFLCLIGFAILLGPTGSGIPINLIGNQAQGEHELSQPNWGTDPASCGATSNCHPNELGNWSLTGHATHITKNATGYISIGSHFTEPYIGFFNASCSQCHTSGWDNSTGTPSYDALGVNCFACHNTTAPYVDYSGDACSTCHTGSGEHPYQYQQWSDSAHANSLTDLRTSSHAGSSCMHCMSTEGFIDQAGDYDPAGDFNPVSCPACHSVHSEWSGTGPAMIRAVNASELCGLCHVGSHHPTYTVWIGGPHNLAGVECIDCHGYDLTPGLSAFLNHTFAVDPDIACGQSDDCHNGTVEWALNQLEEIQSSYEHLVEEFETQATAFTAIVMAYNDTADADYALVDYVLDEVETAVGVAHYYGYDGSSGFHDPPETFEAVNEAFRDFLDAKAYFYENMPIPTTPPPTTGNGVPVDNTLIIVGGAAGGIVVGLLLGVLVGRRR